MKPWERYGQARSRPERRGPWLKYRAAAAQELPSRSWGEAASDLAVSFGSGAGGLLETGGTLYGLATGDMDNIATRHGARTREFYQERKSPALQAREERRQEAIDSAEGQAGKFFTAFRETASDPALYTSFLAEQIPNLVASGAGGRLVGGAASALGAGRVGAGAAATGGAIGTGSALQGAEAGGDAYQRLSQLLGSDAEALGLARRAAAKSAAFSGVVNTLIPGARSVERVLGGGARAATRTLGSRAVGAGRGFAGETLAESADEGFGQYASNVAVSEADPEQQLTEGLGQALAEGALFGPFGAVSGAVEGGRRRRTEDAPLGDALAPEQRGTRPEIDAERLISAARGAESQVMLSEEVDSQARTPQEDEGISDAEHAELGDELERMFGPLPEERPSPQPTRDKIPPTPPNPQTETPEFRRWFGGSRVTDREGQPLRVYHGTPFAGFTEFSKEKRGSMTGARDAREGFFFAASPQFASEFTGADMIGEEGATPRQSGVYPAYLRMENPHIERDLTLSVRNMNEAAGVLERARERGHDGVIFEQTDYHADDGPRQAGQTFVVFEPEQIKSATGNVGTFDPASPDITQLEGVEVEERSAAELTPEQRRAVERLQARETQPQVDEQGRFEREMVEDSRREGREEAERRGLTEAVDALFEGAENAPEVIYVSDLAGLDPDARRRLKLSRGRRLLGAYDPKENVAYIVSSAHDSPAAAAWTVAHEVAGHAGFQGLITRGLLNREARQALVSARRLARQNPTIDRLATQIARKRSALRSERAVLHEHAAEEAIAELAAAVRTGNYDRIAERYGVTIPEAQRATLRGAIERFVQRIKQLIERALGREGAFTDAQVWDLVEGAWRYVREGASRDAGARPARVAASEEATIFRAHSGDDLTKIKKGSHWSPDESTATAYTDNPGFGGPEIRTAQMPADAKVLDAGDVHYLDVLEELARTLGYDDPTEVAREWWSSGYRYPWEESSDVLRRLEESGYDFLRYVDDFPEGAITLRALRDFDLGG